MEHNKILKQKEQIRIKKVCKHANPLFEKWLLEWAGEASKRNSNMKYNFQRAVASLRRYPLPLHSGKECLLLAHFGDKICKLIDKKLEEYINENGPINWDDVVKVVDENHRKKVKKKKSLKTDSLQRKPVMHSKDSHELKPTGKKGNQYIPAYRSGPYALISALFHATKADNFSGYLKKNDLIDAAQKFCDASFVIPPSGSHYTAWSCMSTLTKKNLIIREGNPSRYSLTEDGKNLGQILEKNKNVLASQIDDSQAGSDLTSAEFDYKEHVSSCKLSRISEPQSSRNVHNISGSESEDEYPKNKLYHNSGPYSGVNACSSTSASGSEVILLTDDEGEDNDKCFLYNDLSGNLSERSYENEEVSFQKELCLLGVKNSSQRSETRINNTENESDEQYSPWLNKKELKFTFIDSTECETSLKDNALVKIDPAAGSLMFLIKCKLCDLLNASVEYEFDESRTASPGYTYVYLHDSCAPDFSSLNVKNQDLPKPLPGISVGTSCCKMTEKFTGNLEDNSFHISKKPKRISPPDLLALAAGPTDIPQCSNYKDVIYSTEENIINHSNVNIKQLFSFLPDQFKIILCVDNMEVTGGYSSGKKGSKDIIINELKSNGVDFDVRKLSVGDFLWVCQEKYPSGNKFREIVLPFIVERKRMDDLASSIRDGRFREQKFRLKKSGLKNLIYLVEEIGSNHLSIPLSTCEQAFTNTQFIDDFTVKITADQRESAAYLTVMTRYLQQKYKNKMIDCLEMEKFLNEETIMKDMPMTGPSFEELNNFSIKNQVLSVQDMFAKHLLQLSGNSVDKVTAIITKYPTPALLREALENLPSSQKEQFLSTLKCPKSARPIGSTISSQVARLYTWTELA